MLKLFLLLLCLVLLSVQRQSPHLIIFTSEGAFYKLIPETKQVQWYRQLGTSLLSFEMGPHNDESLPSSYVLPTLDGHFMYVDAQTQILIKREEVEQLLHVCLEGNNQDKVRVQAIEYFVYEKFEYHIINLKNGAAQDIETFLKNGIPSTMNEMVVLKNSKKYLKQLKKDLSVAWSTISSDLEVIPALLFLQDPKTISLKNPSESQYTFRRVGNTEIEMVSEGYQPFELGGKSHILSIFEFISLDKGYLKHPLKYYQKSAMALGYISHKKDKAFQQLIEQERLKSESNIFIHSEQIRKEANCQPNEVEQCLNIFRTLQNVADGSKLAHTHFHSFDASQLNGTNSLSFKPYEGVSLPIVYGPTESQPYLWVALLLMIILLSSLGIGLYRIKINSLLHQISLMESKTGEKLQEFQKKLGQMEELKKMYEVYWQKVIYQVGGDQWYEHVVFEGKFLNQSAIVYAVRLEGTDVVSLEHKLNILLNFSHIGLCKLYYYTKNTQFLLIFTEKLVPLNLRTLPDDLQVPVPANEKKRVISHILSAAAYLDSKIEINCLPNEALDIQPIKVPEGESYYDFKLNAVPCLLKRSQDDSDFDQSRSGSADSSTFELRINLVSIFHLIIHEGKRFSKEILDEKLKNQAYSQDQYLQFFDFVLYEVRGKADKDIESGGTTESARELMFKDVLDHPYLWDSKRKILFLSDFSNYIQTHIDESKVRKLESHALEYKVIKTPWIKEFHFTFVREVSNYRKYDYESVRDLIRVIRNKLNHFHEIPKDVKNNIGKTPEGFIEYCLDLFPKLLHFAFVYTRKKKWKLHMK